MIVVSMNTESLRNAGLIKIRLHQQRAALKLKLKTRKNYLLPEEVLPESEFILLLLLLDLDVEELLPLLLDDVDVLDLTEELLLLLFDEL